MREKKSGQKINQGKRISGIKEKKISRKDWYALEESELDFKSLSFNLSI